jgi:hypothetical protein
MKRGSHRHSGAGFMTYANARQQLARRKGRKAAFLIGTLPPKVTSLSSAIAVRFSPALPGWIIAR